MKRRKEWTINTISNIKS